MDREPTYRPVLEVADEGGYTERQHNSADDTPGPTAAAGTTAIAPFRWMVQAKLEVIVIHARRGLVHHEARGLVHLHGGEL